MAEILIAEDDSPNRNLLSYRLRKMGHNVIALNNGIDALRTLEYRFCNLAILDIGMPGLNGISLLKKIRSSSTILYLPIIILTASALDDHRNNAFDFGADRYFCKPISFHLLNEAVASLVN